MRFSPIQGFSHVGSRHFIGYFVAARKSCAVTVINAAADDDGWSRRPSGTRSRMIHIIGTDPYFQVSTTVKRRGAAKQEMAKFQRYLSTAAKRLGAAMVAEEASAEWVKDHGPGAISVARRVAAQMRVRHRYCDPDRGERRTCGLKVGGELWDQANAISMETRRDVVAVWREEVRKGFQAREDFWLGRLKVRGLDKVAVIFVCGADHVDTFKATLGANGIQARIHCRDWPNDMSGDSSGEALSHR